MSWWTASRRSAWVPDRRPVRDGARRGRGRRALLRGVRPAGRSGTTPCHATPSSVVSGSRRCCAGASAPSRSRSFRWAIYAPARSCVAAAWRSSAPGRCTRRCGSACVCPSAGAWAGAVRGRLARGQPPVEPTADLGEGPLIAVDIKASVEHPGSRRAPRQRPPRIAETVMRVLLLGTANTSEAVRRHADLLIEPRADAGCSSSISSTQRVKPGRRRRARRSP